MRNLKKILALVLALMMVLSVMVTASAAFEDDADIAHKEAVDVMVAAGILAGDGNGNFRPADALERSAAAKLIAYLLLGESIQYVEQTETVFTDVPMTHWASGFVGYVNETGIVVGNGNGEFNPNGSINGYSFAKMVLLALVNLHVADMADVDPTASEKVAPLTGNYTLKVRLAIATLKEKGIDLLAGLEDISLNGALSREHAAQMVFNALNGDSAKTTNLLAEVYGLTKEEKTEGGLTGYVWNKDDKAATELVITDTLVASFPSGTTYGNVMKALGITKNSKTAGVNYYNTAKGNACTPADYAEGELSKLTVPATYSLDVYKSGETLKFMYTIETLATASVAKEAEKTGDNKGLYKWTFGGAYTYAAKDAYTDKGVYVVAANGTELVAEPVLATVETGKILAKGEGYVYVNNTAFSVLDGVSVPALSATTEYDLYLASDKTVLAIAEVNNTPVVVETPEVLVYVVDNYSLFVKGTPAVPAQKDQYGVDIPNTAVPAVPDRTDLYVQGIDMNGNEVNYLVSKTYDVNAVYAVEIDAKTGVATLTTPEKSNVVGADNLTEAGAKFSVAGKNFYVTSAEYVVVSGTKGDMKVSTGSRKAAAAATNAIALFTGDISKESNLTVTKVIYYVAPDASVPTVDVEAIDGMFAVYEISTDSALIEVKNEKGETAYETIWAHVAMINGQWTVIYTYDAEQTVAGAATYKVDEYGVYYDITAAKNQQTVMLTNQYGTLATLVGTATFEDYDIANIPVIDVMLGLDENANGALDLGEWATVMTKTDAEGKVTIELIYVITAVKVEG